MTEKILNTEFGDVHYWITEPVDKNRMTLFFLHGLTASHALFEKQIPYFSANYNVIVWDAPAHGLSRPYADFSYEKAAHDAIAVLDTADIDSAVFIGQSMGGFITQSVIKRSPERVLGFVSIDSTPFGEKYYSGSDKWWLKQIEWMSALYPDKSLRNAVAKQCTRTERSYQNMLDMLSVYDKKELCHLMGIGFAGFLDDNSDITIDCPVLLIVGEHDKTGKVISYNKAWAQDIGVQITWIKDAAHNSNDDQPEQVNEQIDLFLAEIRIDMMEELYDQASEALNSDDPAILAIQEVISKLEEYYTGPLWKADLALDEAGKLSSNLKRGVLSEDGIYDLLDRYKELKGE